MRERSQWLWTEDMFVKSIKLGKHMGTSRPVLPPMPWPAFRNFTDDDLKAMYAYLTDAETDQKPSTRARASAGGRDCQIEIAAGHGPLTDSGELGAEAASRLTRQQAGEYRGNRADRRPPPPFLPRGRKPLFPAIRPTFQ